MSRWLVCLDSDFWPTGRPLVFLGCEVFQESAAGSWKAESESPGAKVLGRRPRAKTRSVLVSAATWIRAHGLGHMD